MNLVIIDKEDKMKVFGRRELGTPKMTVPIKSWCNEPEAGAIEQSFDLAILPFVFKQVCLMPDTHQGYGMPIGGVIATKGVVVPNCVGSDIGCGMSAVKTSLTDLSQEDIKKIFGGSKEYKGGIRGRVPVGSNWHSKDQYWDDFSNAPDTKIIQDNLSKAKKQLGTLGAGNHFIEIQKGDDGHIWIMIHSGSRNFGHKIASHYNKIAQDLCTKWYSNIPKFKGEDGLAFLPLDSKEGKEYLEAMNFALDYAYENRRLMMKRILICFEDALGLNCDRGNWYSISSMLENMTNIHHNYAQIEHHFGRNVMVHRKGATSAKKGEIGIIPGSQGTASYIVKGKGNPESFMSCSHGAGRKMSRTKAIHELDLEEVQKRLDEKGIIHTVRNKNDLDEADGAYKDIDIVMEEQKDLVDIVVKLKPLGCIKGKMRSKRK